MKYTFDELIEIIECIWCDPQNDGDALQALWKYAKGLQETLYKISKEYKKNESR